MDLEQLLRAAFVLRAPQPDFEEAVMERLAVRGWRNNQGVRRRSIRIVLVVAALAAAAAVLWPRLRDVPEPAPAPQLEIASAPASVPDVVEAPKPEPVPAPEPPAPPPAPKPTAPAINTFTVRLLLQDRTQDEAARATIRKVHAVLLEKLRAVPGLVLLDDAAGTTDVPEYRLTLAGQPGSQASQIGSSLTGERLGPDGSRIAMGASVGSTQIAPDCTGPAPGDVSLLVSNTSCRDALSSAAVMVAYLRRHLFPPDPSLRRELATLLLDQQLDSAQRLQALGDIATISRAMAAQAEGKAAANARFTAAEIRGAVELASTATSPALRAQVWRTLRGVRSPLLVGPLLDASRQETNAEARLEAVATLAADFAAEARVRAVLESVADADSRVLVRAVARRGLAGEESWQQYVLASLQDEGRSDAERIEALVHHYFDRSRPNAVARDPQRGFGLLDDATTRALAQVVPRLRPSAELTPAMLGQLAVDVSAIRHPAITDMLINSLSGSSQLLAPRAAIWSLLGNGEDARLRTALEGGQGAAVRKALEQARDSERDQERRERVASILHSVAVPATP